MNLSKESTNLSKEIGRHKMENSRVRKQLTQMDEDVDIKICFMKPLTCFSIFDVDEAVLQSRM
jgi:hypothetical protein